MVLIYRERLWQLADSFLHPARMRSPCMGRRRATTRSSSRSRSASTAVLGVLVKKLGFELPEDVAPVAWALVIGAIWMAGRRTAARRKRAVTLGERATITWTVAILVGVAQVVAGVFPGTSRSAATIFVALLFGTTNRAAATEFAFLVGIPTMFAATGYELLDVPATARPAGRRLGPARGRVRRVGIHRVRRGEVAAALHPDAPLHGVRDLSLRAGRRAVAAGACALSDQSVRVWPPSTSTIAPCM